MCVCACVCQSARGPDETDAVFRNPSLPTLPPSLPPSFPPYLAVPSATFVPPAPARQSVPAIRVRHCTTCAAARDRTTKTMTTTTVHCYRLPPARRHRCTRRTPGRAGVRFRCTRVLAIAGRGTSVAFVFYGNSRPPAERTERPTDSDGFPATS